MRLGKGLLSSVAYSSEILLQADLVGSSASRLLPSSLSSSLSIPKIRAEAKTTSKGTSRERGYCTDEKKSPKVNRSSLLRAAPE